jgi:hypothetical protein
VSYYVTTLTIGDPGRATLPHGHRIHTVLRSTVEGNTAVIKVLVEADGYGIPRKAPEVEVRKA